MQEPYYLKRVETADRKWEKIRCLPDQSLEVCSVSVRNCLLEYRTQGPAVVAIDQQFCRMFLRG
eukprot:4738204-Karenia_brevis.AAC.1